MELRVQTGKEWIIPAKLRMEVLNIIHKTHLRLVKSKQLACDNIFWPGINQQIEDQIACCVICQSFRKSQLSEPLVCHEIPNNAFEKVRVHLCSSRQHKLFASYRLLLKISRGSSINTEVKYCYNKGPNGNILSFRSPKIIASENGLQYASDEYKKCASEFDINLSFTSPHYPQSIGTRH